MGTMVVKRKLKLVANNEQPRKAGKWQGIDDVFFHHSQVRIGTRLINYGRLDHGSIWEVREMFELSQSGRRKRVDAIEYLRDTHIVLIRIGSNETRQMKFAGLSYSAIWRLAP